MVLVSFVIPSPSFGIKRLEKFYKIHAGARLMLAAS